MIEPEWIQSGLVETIHQEQINEHGGLTGVRDAGLLDSALARPRQLFSFGDPDLCDLAAAYAFGIARNHPFLDGNKRTAFVVCELFLTVNKASLSADDETCIKTMLALAAGEMTAQAYADWLRSVTRLEP